MFLHCFQTPGLSINTYLIADPISKKAVIIDPTRNIQPYIKFAEEHNFEISYITETHVHADFISGALELKKALKNKPKIICSALGGPEWTPQYADQKITEKVNIELGQVRLESLHTPGHTPEHIIWICYDESRSSETPCAAFTGDLLFVGSIGRPDLLGEDQQAKLSQELYHSLFTVLKDLPDYTEIFPAHGAGSLCGKSLSARPSSTLGYERRFNMYLNPKPEHKWLQDLSADRQATPPANFYRIKKLNVQGLSMNTSTNDNPIIIDLRHPEIYARKHIEDSLNIPFGGAFCNWVGSVITSPKSIILVGESSEQLNQATKELHLIGFDRVEKSIVFDEPSVSKNYNLTSLNLIDTTTLKKTQANYYIVDVRTQQEWNANHIDTAHHIELPSLTTHYQSIPKNQAIAVICGSGYRASVAASWLKQQGYANVANVKGGMNAWLKT